jgi:hypothetical protein
MQARNYDIGNTIVVIAPVAAWFTPQAKSRGLAPVSALGSKTADCTQTHNTPQTPKNLKIIFFAVEK